VTCKEKAEDGQHPRERLESTSARSSTASTANPSELGRGRRRVPHRGATLTNSDGGARKPSPTLGLPRAARSAARRSRIRPSRASAAGTATADPHDSRTGDTTAGLRRLDVDQRRLHHAPSARVAATISNPLHDRCLHARARRGHAHDRRPTATLLPGPANLKVQDPRASNDFPRPALGWQAGQAWRPCRQRRGAHPRT